MKNKKYSYVGERNRKPKPKPEPKVEVKKVEIKKEKPKRQTCATRKKEDENKMRGSVFGFSNHDDC